MVVWGWGGGGLLRLEEGWEGRQTKGGRRFGPYVKTRQEAQTSVGLFNGMGF